MWIIQWNSWRTINAYWCWLLLWLLFLLLPAAIANITVKAAVPKGESIGISVDCCLQSLPKHKYQCCWSLCSQQPTFFFFSVWGTLNAAWDPDQRRACVSGAVLDSQTALKILPSQLCCREWGLAEERVLTWHHLPQEGATMSLDTLHFLAHFSLRRRIVFSCW